MKVLNIRLNRKEDAKKCIDNNQIRIFFSKVRHNDCINKRWDRIEKACKYYTTKMYTHKDISDSRRKAMTTRYTNEIKTFYEADEEVLWITFYEHKLWWGFAKPIVRIITDENINNIKVRDIIGGWQVVNLSQPKKVRENILNINRHFRGTICDVDGNKIKRSTDILKLIHWEKLNVNSRIPEEIEKDTVLNEGAKKQIAVNAYERNSEARRKCIEHYGYACSVCGFEFVHKYGILGEGYVHVHHLKLLSKIGKNYQVDPIKDLRPVCPNCHSMLHRKTPMLSMAELKRLVNRRSKKDSKI